MKLLRLNNAMDQWSVLEVPHQTSSQSSDKVQASFISLVDISSQLRQALSLCNPLFTLLAFGNNLTLSSVVRRVCNEMTDKSKVQYGLVNVLHNNSEWIDIHSSNSSDSANDCRRRV